MAASRLDPILRQIHQLVASTAVENLSDALLLRRYVDSGDQDAFHALLQRHGALVWRVCRRVTGHDETAQDAFQATFLVFTRKARFIRKPASLASWLHGVAFRVAREAVGQLSRRHDSMVADRYADN